MYGRLCGGEIRSTILTLNELGETIGYWDVDRETWMKPGHFFLKVIVTLDQRCQGLGSQMYAEALRFARENGATHLKVKYLKRIPPLFSLLKHADLRSSITALTLPWISPPLTSIVLTH